MRSVGDSPVVQIEAAVVTTPRRLQFSLRALLLLMVLASACCGWVMKERRHIEQRRIALASFGEFHQIDPQPTWRLWLLGDDTPRYAHKFSTTTWATLDAMTYLAELDQLDSLTLDGSRFTEAKWQCLRYFARLKELSLIDFRITGAELRHLCELKKLEKLWLLNCQVTHAGVVPLKKLSQLHVLRIDGSQVSSQCETDLRQAMPHCTVILGRGAQRCFIQLARSEAIPTEAKK